VRKNLRVLVSAYACAPGQGSEPGIGSEWIRHVARLHEVWVITWPGMAERAKAEKSLSNVHWQFSDLRKMRWVWDIGPAGESLFYYLWQMGMYRIAKRLHTEVDFDLVHHITLGKYWAPSSLCLLQAPFIWGPVGGGDSGPTSLWSTLSWRGRLYETARTFGQALEEVDPFVRLTARRATLGWPRPRKAGADSARWGAAT
jgi:hypothetical protein